MVATDIFGRGIDIERVNIVINYDMPENADSYLHRVRLSQRIPHFPRMYQLTHVSLGRASWTFRNERTWNHICSNRRRPKDARISPRPVRSGHCRDARDYRQFGLHEFLIVSRRCILVRFCTGLLMCFSSSFESFLLSFLSAKVCVWFCL